MEHGSTGHPLNLTDQPLALGFADSRPRLTDEIRATAQNEDALVRGEDVAEEGDVARRRMRRSWWLPGHGRRAHGRA